MMCFNWGAQPYRVYKLEEAPKKKEEKKQKETKEYRMFNEEAYNELYGGPAPAPAPAPAAVASTQSLYYGPQPGHAFMAGPSVAYATPAIFIYPGPAPTPAPAPKALPASASDKYWCKEMDGSYTLRTLKEIGEDLQPGKWDHDKESGHPYWVRFEEKKKD